MFLYFHNAISEAGFLSFPVWKLNVLRLDAVEKKHLNCMFLSKYFHFGTLNKINLDLYKNARRLKKKLKNLRNLNPDLYYRIFG